MSRHHGENHRIQHIGWLRAAVLGANDGIVSTASLLVGVAASHATHGSIVITGIAGLVAGSLSMAAGEYVSVSSQLDTERADLERERKELLTDFKNEHKELAGIYVKRGVDMHLADQVATQLMAKDALGAHARDELGISEAMTAKPLQAAVSSALSFAAGATLPLLTVFSVSSPYFIFIISFVSLASLAFLGFIAASTSGASRLKSVLRVTFWGALAMGVTAVIGSLFGA